MRLAVLLVMLVCASSILSAQAVVIHRPAQGVGTCVLPGANADGSIIYTAGMGDVVQIVDNENAVSILCRGFNLPNASGRAQHYTGFACYVIEPDLQTGNYRILFTTDSHATVAENGYVTAKCTAKK